MDNILEMEDEDDMEELMEKLDMPRAFGRVVSGPAKLSTIGQRISQPAEGPGRGEEERETSEGEANDSADEGHEFGSQFIPMEYAITINAHDNNRHVCAMSLNPKGSRMITGGLDNQVRMWDFNGMTTDMRWFRSFCPLEGHGVQSLHYSTTGSAFLCAGGDAICRLYDVDGKMYHRTVQGDMYVRDMNNTKGHTHMATDVQWHPFDREKFLSASMDATVRIWDTTSKAYGLDQALPHLHCLKAVDKRRLNIACCHVTTARWAPGAARFILGGCADGSLQLWNEKKCYGKPDKICRPAHGEGCAVTGLAVFNDDTRVLSRGEDDTLKLWDLRKFKDAVHVWKDLPNVNPKTNVALSPSESVAVTACSAERKDGTGCLKFFALDKPEATPLETISLDAGSPIRVEWPEEINQVIATCTNATVRCYVDSKASRKGALLIARSAPRKRRDEFKGFNEPIFTPQTLPTGYKETKSGAIRKVKPRVTDLDKAQKTIVPPRPSGKEGAQGQVATVGTMSQFLLGSINKKPLITEEDSAEVLRSYANLGEDEPVFVSKLYKVTQPKPIFDTRPDADDELERLTVKCPRCGLKLCQCGYMASDGLKDDQTKKRGVGDANEGSGTAKRSKTSN